jgi:hypothetical protein
VCVYCVCIYVCVRTCAIKPLNEAVRTLAMNLQVRACVCIHVCVHTCAIKPLNEAVHTLAMHLQVCVLCVCVFMCVYIHVQLSH